jgi:hypothetical protein
MTEQRHIHTGRQGVANPTELDAVSNPGTKQDKKSQVGLNFDDEDLVGQRICALLNLGLSDLPEPILNRIMASRNRALEFHKYRCK